MGISASTILTQLSEQGITINNNNVLKKLEPVEYIIMDAQPWITEGDYTVYFYIFYYFF